MIKITKIQLFVLIIVFQIGSTTLFAVGIGAKQDAWIVVLLAALIGFCLLWIYTCLAEFFPNQTYFDILISVLGKKVASPLILFYGLYFINIASHNIYEFGVFIKLTALPKTPLIVIFYLFVAIIIYINSLGFEVLARTAEALTFLLLFFLLTIFTFTLFSGQFNISELKPVLGYGIQPVLKELWRVVAFPFGEMVLFLMFYHYLQDQSQFRRTAFFALSVSATLLTLSLIVIISVLGTSLTENAEIPLLETILLINIADIIVNLDSLAVFILFIGGFYKTALYLYAFSLVLNWLFKSIDLKWFIRIVGLILPLYVFYYLPGLDYQRLKVEDILLYTIIMYAFLPVFLLMNIYIIKRKKNFN